MDNKNSPAPTPHPPSASTPNGVSPVPLEGAELQASDGERLVLGWNGWCYGPVGQENRVTVDEAVHPAGKYGRAQVFAPTRKYVAWIGQELSDGAWSSPLTSTGPNATSRSMPASQIRLLVSC